MATHQPQGRKPPWRAGNPVGSQCAAVRRRSRYWMVAVWALVSALRTWCMSSMRLFRVRNEMVMAVWVPFLPGEGRTVQRRSSHVAHHLRTTDLLSISATPGKALSVVASCSKSARSAAPNFGSAGIWHPSPWGAVAKHLRCWKSGVCCEELCRSCFVPSPRSAPIKK